MPPASAQSTLAPERDVDDEDDGSQVFVDPVFGTPLSLYVASDVENRENIADLISSNGGIAAPGYSNVPYILVDPRTKPGQTLFRQYVSKKNKVVLDARWVHECLRHGKLQTVFDDWAGCKVTGEEMDEGGDTPDLMREGPEPPEARRPPESEHDMQSVSSNSASYPYSYHPHPPDAYHALYAQHHAPVPRYSITPGWPMPPSPSSMSVAVHPHSHPELLYRHDSWDHYHGPSAAIGGAGPSNAAWDDRYQQWAPAHSGYYDQPYQYPADDFGAPTPPTVEGEPTVADAGTTTRDPVMHAERQRGRKRSRAEALVATNRNPRDRSPTPPTRVVKSQYGGNVFTQEDVEYLNRYVAYIQRQGLMMSLREVCERIAVKAPHHTFYSWRRYCNKHQIKLGGYTINDARRSSSSPEPAGLAAEAVAQVQPHLSQVDPLASQLPESTHSAASIPYTLTEAAHPAFLLHMPALADVPPAPPPIVAPPAPPSRSPSPPKALFKSTTGKGVAFTQEDVQFLVRFLDYRKSLGKVDMVTFWRDVASKAPHHSKASWMKYWRRHKHELSGGDGHQELPILPEKKKRYSRADDILLARYFLNKPRGTSDHIFQEFSRMHPHHPWKGWQEHHRIHKAAVDMLIHQIEKGESLELPEVGTDAPAIHPDGAARMSLT